MWKFVKRSLAVLVISLLTFEGLSAGAVHLGLIPANAPSYVWPGFTPFWAATDRHFGMWHPPHGHFNHVKPCFNVVYRANAHGARDKARPLSADGRRVVMLGDSFVEGYGLARRDRVSDRLEAATGIPHLNFGTSGGFGPTQYLLQYKTLVTKFSHDAVILGILPDNDFTDDDPAIAEARRDTRYAPYFHTTADGYTLRYRNADALGTSESGHRRARKRGLRAVLRSFSYSINVIDYFKAAITYQRALDRSLPGNAKAYSGYVDYSPAQWQRMAHVIGAFLSATKGKPVLIVLIPRPNDIRRVSADRPTRLATAVRALLGSQPNAAVIDLLDGFAAAADPSVFYNKCDGHWSVAGAAMATRLIRASAFYQREITP